MELTQREQQLMSTVKRFQRFQFSRLHPNFSRGASWLLLAVYESGTDGITVSELAERIQMPAPAVSRLLKGLEQDGLIQRTILPQDRRSILVTTTDQGKTRIQTMMAEMHDYWQAVLDPIPPEQFDAMLNSWNELADRMEQILEEKTKQTDQSKEVET
jgi:DNA-binding MarR family transcriptional regulator